MKIKGKKTLSLFLGFLIVLGATTFCFSAHVTGNETVDSYMPVYYVSSTGSDSNDGLTAEEPFATLKKATSKAADGDILIYILGSYVLKPSDITSHSSVVTICGYDDESEIISENGYGVGFGGPAILKNITYTRGTNAYIVTSGQSIVFDDGFAASSSSDWFVFGGSQGCSVTPGFDVTVKDGSFTGEFVLGGMMPVTGHHVTGDVSLYMFGGNVNTVKLGSSGWASCAGTTFDKNVLIYTDGGNIEKIGAISSGNGSPTIIAGALQIILNNSMTTTLDSSLDAVSAGSRYIVLSGNGGSVAPVYDVDGNLIPGKVSVSIEKDGDSATIINGSIRTYLDSDAEITLEEGITEVIYGEKQLETGTTIPMTWKEMDKGYITLIFDDNNSSLPEFYNIITGEYNMPICAAVPSSSLNNNNNILHEIQNHGGEILSHTKDHLVLNSTIPWETVDYQLGQSWRELTDAGFNVNGIILAGGTGQDQSESYRAQIEPFTNKYYLYSDKYGISTQYWKPRNWFSGRSVDELKAIIDEQIENKTWEVIYAHNFDECSEETLRAVLDYLAEKKAQGLVDVVTYRYMHETFGDWQGEVDFGDTNYTVEFYGTDNKTYLGKCVAVRGQAAALENKLKIEDGYTFKGWSESINNIEDNMKVYAICVDENGDEVSTSIPSVVTSSRIYYVNANSGSDTNTGESAESAFATINAAVAAAQDGDFEVVIIGTYTPPVNVPSHSGVMTIYGADNNAILATHDGWGYYLGGPVIIRDINFKNGLYSYVYTRGDKVILGENITTSGSHQIIAGSNNNYVTQSSDMEIYSGSYYQLTLGEIASSEIHTIKGDMKAVIHDGTIRELILGSTGWSQNHKGVVYEGNILLRVDGGEINSIKTSLNNYLANYNGAVEIIFNNGTDAGFDESFINSEAAEGKYLVYCSEGGHADFAYSDGKSRAGYFDITVPENHCAKIQNGSEVQYLLETGTAKLLPGTTYITFENLDYFESEVIRVVSESGENYFYVPADSVIVNKGGTIYFPAQNDVEGKLFGGWYSDPDFNTPVMQGNKVEAETILYARWIDLAAEDLYIEGVQVRIEGEMGLRYISGITNLLRDTLIGLNDDNIMLDPEDDSFNTTEGIGYGMVLLPEIYLGEDELIKDGIYNRNGKDYGSKTVPARKIYERLEDFDRYTAVIIGIHESNYSRRYTSRAYVTYTDASGIIHTKYGDPYTANLYDIARIIYESGAEEEPEEDREKILSYLYENILTKNDGIYNPLANTYRALVNDKKLTVGYLGGSITNGYSALKGINEDGTVYDNGGDLMLSYVNRTTTWLKEKYPDAVIEGVNAGVSDTGTNFGIYRLKDQLMNENGHDMPDLVFVEFTSNDWTYSGGISQNSKDLLCQTESLVHNIYELNPYADIVFVFTARSENASSRKQYIEIAEAYGIPYIDMGIPLQKKMTERGASNESTGSYYYTVDNLHPSTVGYGIYFEEIKAALMPYLDTPVYYNEKANHTENLPLVLSRSLWVDPNIIPASVFTVTGNVIKEAGLVSNQYGISQTESSEVYVTPDSIRITRDGTKVEFTFTGTTVSLIFGMNSSGVNADYRIDGKDWKNINIDTELLSFQKYDHTQLFVLEQELAYGTHTVEMIFRNTSDGKVNVRLGGAAVAGEDNHMDKLIALTIDDGPRTDTSNAILDVLEKYGAHATFFCVGDNIKTSTYPVMQRMLELNCEIGNHGNGWNVMSGMTPEQLTADYNAVQDKVYAAVGVYPKVFRAPGLNVSQTMYDTIPLPFMGGNLGIPDWDESVGLEDRINALRNNIEDGRIVLIHDVALNAEALEIVLPEIIDQGFKVVTVTELYTLRGYNPSSDSNMQYTEFSK